MTNYFYTFQAYFGWCPGPPPQKAPCRTTRPSHKKSNDNITPFPLTPGTLYPKNVSFTTNNSNIHDATEMPIINSLWDVLDAPPWIVALILLILTIAALLIVKKIRKYRTLGGNRDRVSNIFKRVARAAEDRLEHDIEQRVGGLIGIGNPTYNIHHDSDVRSKVHFAPFPNKTKKQQSKKLLTQ